MSELNKDDLYDIISEMSNDITIIKDMMKGMDVLCDMLEQELDKLECEEE